jgi:predicted KAP-like P-loop ATPase
MSGTPPGLSAEDLISNRALAKEDADDFGYSAIAGRIAETILGLEPPLTLGLFGPWGSGKSSFCELLRRDLANRDRSVRLVKYDASTEASMRAPGRLAWISARFKSQSWPR